MHLSHFADYSFMATLNKEQNFTDLKVTQKLKKRFLTLLRQNDPMSAEYIWWKPRYFHKCMGFKWDTFVWTINVTLLIDLLFYFFFYWKLSWRCVAFMGNKDIDKNLIK